MFSLIDSGVFAICAIALLICFSSLFFCCRSKKKVKGQQHKQALLLKSSIKSSDKPTGVDTKESAEAATKGKQKHAKVAKTQVTIGAGGTLGIKTAKVFTPRVEAKKITTPAAEVKPLPGTSDKSKKTFKTTSEAGVAVPADDTAPDTARLEVSDSWKETRKPKYKLPEEMTRRRLDDPNYQTWRGLENVFGKKGSDDMSPESKSRVDSKSNLSTKSKSSNEPNSSMMEGEDKAKQAKSEGDTKEVTLQSNASVTDKGSNKTKGDKEDNTKSGHDDDNEGKIDEKTE